MAAASKGAQRAIAVQLDGASAMRQSETPPAPLRPRPNVHNAMQYPGSPAPEGSLFNPAAAEFSPCGSLAFFDPRNLEAGSRDVDTQSMRSAGSTGSGSSRRRHRRRSGAQRDQDGRLPVFHSMQPADSGSDRGSLTLSGRSSPTNSIDSLTASFDSLRADGKMAPRTRVLVTDLVAKLNSSDESRAATAAKNVFDIVRDTCPTWRENQTMICRSSEVLVALTGLLHSHSERCRFEACRALGNVAFQNPGVLGQALHPSLMSASGAADALDTDNCLTIVSTNGMLEGLLVTLKSGNINSKHEAARVINNCAAYSAPAAEAIAKYKGILLELKALCGDKGRAQRTRAKAIGALSCLSTYPSTHKHLVAAGIVDDALIPTLQQKKKIFGDLDEYKAMRADAVMIMANLVGREEHSAIANEPDGLKTVVKCLEKGLNRKVWAGITWTAYSSLLPLSNLTISDMNKDILADLGLVELLLQCLIERISRTEEILAIDCLNNMVFCNEGRRRMIMSKAKDLLNKVVETEGIYPDETGRKARRILWLLNRQNEPPALQQLVQRYKASPGQGAHIFLNFCQGNSQWAHEIKLVRNTLDGMGYPVWFNTTSGEGEMADAIVSSGAVVLCVTRAFKEDTHCRISGEVALDTGKAIILLVMEEGFRADSSWGWLSRIAASGQTIVFHGDLSAAVYKLQCALQSMVAPRVKSSSPNAGVSLNFGHNSPSVSSPLPHAGSSRTPPPSGRQPTFSPNSSPQGIAASPTSMRPPDMYSPYQRQQHGSRPSSASKSSYGSRPSSASKSSHQSPEK